MWIAGQGVFHLFQSPGGHLDPFYADSLDLFDLFAPVTANDLFQLILRHTDMELDQELIG